MTRDLLRAIPPIHELLEAPEAHALAARTSHDFVRDRLRDVVDEIRAEIAAGMLDVETDALAREILVRLEGVESTVSLRRVINATGVVLHTNLGRAPLSRRAIDAVASIAGGYSNLEFDLVEGRRGQRDSHGEVLLCKLLGCEAAVVANNNAAAVMLVLNTFAAGGEVIVSRGELVEIGGGFRIPEVLERAGCVLREVGTTNRTRVADYERAIGDRTRLLLRVHPSNYRIIGFTERPSTADLADLARRHGIPLVEDLGSGCLVDLDGVGIADEPQCGSVLASGVDVVTFSGDKLLGGPQAGVIAGRRELIDPIRRNPLMRALRVDKMVYAALEATLRAYEEGRPFDEVPTLQMLASPAEEIRRRAERFAASVAASETEMDVSVEPGRSVPGAGSAPGIDLETALLVVSHPTRSAEDLDAALRANDPPIVARIERDRLVIDLRTVLEADEGALVKALGGLGRR